MGGKRRRNDVTDDQIVTSYQETHSIFVTARALGVGSTTAHRVLHKRGVPLTGLAEWRMKATKFREKEQEIRAAYEEGATMADLCKLFGDASAHAFKHAIKRAGGSLRDNPAPLVKEGELERIRDLHNAGMGQMKISIAIGRSQPFVKRVMRQADIPTHRGQGAEHSQWKGGRYMNAEGYVHAWVARDDPMACMTANASHVPEHRLVMARKLGRPLLKTETVHHIDGDRANNAPENLQLRQGKHGKHVVMCCLDCGSQNVGAVAL